MSLKITSADMVAAARARIKEYTTQEVVATLDDPNVVIVDIRDPRERDRTGVIPGAFSCPRGMVEFWIDPQSPYFKDIFGEKKTFIFHCASGWRSALTVATLQDMGFDAGHLKDGFTDWVAEDAPVEKLPKR